MEWHFLKVFDMELRSGVADVAVVGGMRNVSERGGSSWHITTAPRFMLSLIS